jgi:hypothetical protein
LFLRACGRHGAKANRYNSEVWLGEVVTFFPTSKGRTVCKKFESDLVLFS